MSVVPVYARREEDGGGGVQFLEVLHLHHEALITPLRRLGSVKNCPCKNMVSVYKAKVKI